MLGLANAAKAKGLHAVGMKICIDDLVACKTPAIAHLWNNHFTVVSSGEMNDTIMLMDPPGEPVSVKKEDFKKAYSGFALLVSKDVSAFPSPKAEGPDIRFSGYSWDFGSLYEGDVADHTFKCRNVGDKELSISKVESSCSCVIVSAYSQTIPAGGEGDIQILLDTSGQLGNLVRSLTITSDDPISPNVQVDISGYVKSAKLLASPSTVGFGKIRRSQSTEQVVYIPNRKGEEIRVESAKVNSQWLDATLRESTEKDRPGYFISVSVKPGAPLGDIHEKLVITSNHPRQPKAELPISATVTGNIDLDRDTLFFGMVEHGKEGEAKVNISNAGEEPLAIKRVDCPSRLLSFDIETKTNGKEFVLHRKLKNSAPAGLIKDVVTIKTNNPDQPEIQIPVMALVRS